MTLEVFLTYLGYDRVSLALKFTQSFKETSKYTSYFQFQETLYNYTFSIVLVSLMTTKQTSLPFIINL